MRLKLADFGLALHVGNPNNLDEDEAQHQRWCAPECLGMISSYSDSSQTFFLHCRLHQ
jgi:hypothetical protein